MASPRNPRDLSSASSTPKTQWSRSINNPTFVDVLAEEEVTPERAVVAPVIGDYVLQTPSSPTSALVDRLKANTVRSQKQRQDRILNESVSTTSHNPNFANAGDMTYFPSRNASRAMAATTPGSPSGRDQVIGPDLVHEDSDTDCESIALSDGPNPVRATRFVATDTRTSTSDHLPLHDAPTLEQTAGAAVPSAAAGIAHSQLRGADGEASSVSDVDEGRSELLSPQSAVTGGGAEVSSHIATPDAVPVCDQTPQHDQDLAEMLASGNCRAFISTPGPFLNPTLCYIVREKATGSILSKAPHIYRLFHESTKTFLMSARRRKHTKTPSYVVSLHKDDMDRSSTFYFGKIKSNFLGTEFHVYDRGERNQRKGTMKRGISRSASKLSSGLRTSTGSNVTADEDDVDGCAANRTEMAVVQYSMNVMGAKGPRRMVIGVPYVDFDTNEGQVWQPQRPADSMMAHLKNPPAERMIKLVNKVPRWNPSLGAFCLNFNGRVTQASVKNFQLVSEGDEQEREVLQFGRVDQDQFTMDYRWPLTAFQAFCICITSLDSKLACE